jgi:UDP-N-acetylmuramoyl-tripeptide--D-alanyl-D-alanine ligase
VALPGARVHGREFAREALERGAAFVITDQAHPGAIQVPDPASALRKLGLALRQRFGGTVVAVGGSSGKTTTKEALAQGLAWPAPEGNLNNAPGLAQFLWRLDPQAKGAVLELGIDRLGEMDELIEMTRPRVGLLSALGPEHLDGLGSFEAVVREESRLLQATEFRLCSLQAAQWVRLPGLKTYGFGQADFRGWGLELEKDSSRFHYAGRSVRVPYAGLGPALGALGALAVAELLGEPLEGVIERLASLQLPGGRMERLVRGGITILNDAYNANPVSVQAGLEYLKTQPGRKWLVLGEMKELGERSLEYHLEAARQAAAVSERCIFLGTHARAQAQAVGGQAAASVEEVAELLSSVEEGDLVYLKASRSVGLERLLELWPKEAK